MQAKPKLQTILMFMACSLGFFYFLKGVPSWSGQETQQK